MKKMFLSLLIVLAVGGLIFGFNTGLRYIAFAYLAQVAYFLCFPVVLFILIGRVMCNADSVQTSEE